jgi:putative ABC transport system ATP-binding protein
MPLIEAKNLSKTYVTGKNIETPALKGVDVSIFEKDFLALAGPSGSGKSSLLHILGGLDNPTNGTVNFNGHELTKLSQAQLSFLRLKYIGFVFQAYNLINTLTALENVEFIMLLQGVKKEIRRRKSEELLHRVGLKDYTHRFPSEMSGGQQQRVAVARAIAPHPKIVFADEPTANLDSQTAESLIHLMQELNEEHGITFIFSTHDQMIMEKAKRLIRMKDGQIIS